MSRLVASVFVLVALCGPAAAQPRDAVSGVRHDATAGFGPAAVAILQVFGGIAAVGVVGFVGWLLLRRLQPSPTPESDPWVKAQLAKQARDG